MAGRIGLAIALAFVCLVTVRPAHAGQDVVVPDEVVEVATEADVDPVDLLGAMFTTGLAARDYLYAVGELMRPLVLNWQVECIIGKESGHQDVMNRQGSGATGPGQYMPGTWANSTSLFGEPWLDIHNLNDVRRVMAFDLARGQRRAWTVSGC